MVSDGSEGAKLARVTYLPGVTPPSETGWFEPAERDEPKSTEAELATAAPPPDFASFFGGDAEGSDAARSGSADSTAAGSAQRGEDLTEQPTAGRRRPARAENVSMHALTRRGMSRWELEKTLLSREFDEHVVATELDRLEGVGLLDDGALAETFVRTQHERKGLGRGAITAELRRRHIGQEHIDAALEQVDDDDEQTRATELAIKRAGQLSSYDLETAKRRLHGFLSRKGYSSGVVRAAIDEALSPRSSGVRFR